MSVGCPVVPWPVWGLAGVGFCAVAFAVTVLYQLISEAWLKTRPGQTP